jgi:hypothetical protein
MELAARFGAAQSGGLIVAAISAVFTIGCVANQLGEDADWLFDPSIDMFPDDGCLWVYGVGEDGVPAFTEYGIECLRQIIADGELPAERRPRPSRQSSLPAVLTAC